MFPNSGMTSRERCNTDAQRNYICTRGSHAHEPRPRGAVCVRVVVVVESARGACACVTEPACRATTMIVYSELLHAKCRPLVTYFLHYCTKFRYVNILSKLIVLLLTDDKAFYKYTVCMYIQTRRRL